jgi:peptidoglycan/LPS O-acetylase OafA/YrhL
MAIPVERRASTVGGFAQARLAGLDLLRLLAALAVVGFHYFYAGPTRGLTDVSFPEFSDVARYGFLGVQLFFVISGFVIAASVEGRSAWQFGIARAARLYPAHVVCMTMTAVLVAVWPSPYHVTGSQWVANLTMVAPVFGQSFMDGAYWSIVVEITFYGWVGLLLWFGVLQRRLLTILAVWMVVAIVNEAVLGSKVVRLLAITEHAPLFVSGVILQRLWTGDRRIALLMIGAAAVIVGGIHGQSAIPYFDAVYGDRLSTMMLWGLHFGIYGAFVMALWSSRWLAARPAVLVLGGLTYPLYLLHQNAGYTLIGHVEPIAGRWMAVRIVLAGMLAASWLIWRYVEPAGRRLVLAVGARAERILRSIAPRLRLAGETAVVVRTPLPVRRTG